MKCPQCKTTRLTTLTARYLDKQQSKVVVKNVFRNTLYYYCPKCDKVYRFKS